MPHARCVSTTPNRFNDDAGDRRQRPPRTEPLSGRAVSVSWIGEAAGAQRSGRDRSSGATCARWRATDAPRVRRAARSPDAIRVAGDEAAPTIARLTTDQVVGIVSVVLKPER